MIHAFIRPTYSLVLTRFLFILYHSSLIVCLEPLATNAY